LAAHAAAQVVTLSVALSVLLGVVLGGLAEPILRAMSGSESIVATGTGFTRWMLGGNITVFLIFVINAAFRGAGDAVIAMRTLWLANGINIALGPCLVFGWGPFPELGVTGAAIATTIGRATGVVYQLWHLSGHNSRLRVCPRHFWPDPVVMGSVLRLSGAGVLQFFINTSSWIGLMKILALFGSAALAGYTISVRLVMFALLPAWGLANAGATLAGQNLGAGEPQRAEDAVWIAVRYNAIFLAVLGVLCITLATPLVRIFTTEPEALHYGAQALWIVGLGFPLFGAGMALTSAFNGAGDPWTPTLMNFGCFWLGELPMGWLLAVGLGLGPLGVFIAIPIAFSIMTIWAAILFRRGKWKTKQV
jgi:putative MATE family efflux protein